MNQPPPLSRPVYIPNHLVWAILTTLFCCLPLGVVSIVYASQVDGRRAAGDLPTLTRQAHKLKGAAKLVGAMPLAGAALALEAAAKAGQWDQVLPHATDVATAFERLDRYVAETFGPPAA